MRCDRRELLSGVPTASAGHVAPYPIEQSELALAVVRRTTRRLWAVKSKVISRVTIHITHIKELITPPMTTREPPTRKTGVMPQSE